MIFLVRHGEAAASWAEAKDPGLSDLGARQAEATAKALIARGAVRARTSPMTRCIETASAFAALTGMPVPEDPRISEIQTPMEVGEQRSAWLKLAMQKRWQDVGYDFAPWINGVMEAVHESEPGTVLFSHFVAINAVAGRLLGKDDMVVFRPGHASITVLERRNGGLSISELGSEAATDVL